MSRRDDKHGWRELPRQDGRRFVVTGASGGIGRETAKCLPNAAPRVVLAVRNLEKGSGRRAQIAATWRRICSTCRTWPRCGRSPRAVGAVDVLVNNAGVLALPVQYSRRTASRCTSPPTTSATSPSPTCCCRG